MLSLLSSWACGRSKLLINSLGRMICLYLMAPLVTMAVCVSAEAATFAYVTNLGADYVSVIDTRTHTVVDKIPLASAGSGNVAITPDGARAYVTSFSPDSSVYIINTVTKAVIGAVAVPTADAQGVGVTPDGTRAYLTNSLTNTVTVIDTVFNAATATISVPSRPWFVRFTPGGTKGFVVGNGCPGTVSVIDTNPKSSSYNTVLKTIPAGCFPGSVAMTPNGRFAWVDNGRSEDVLVIDTSTYAVVHDIVLGAAVNGLAVTPNGKFAYVVVGGSNSVAVISTATDKVVTRVPVGNGALDIAITPDGLFAYVTNASDGTVSVISTVTNTVADTISVGGAPFGISMQRPCQLTPIQCNG